MYNVRAVETQGAGGAIAAQFDRSVELSSFNADYAHHITTRALRIFRPSYCYVNNVSSKSVGVYSIAI